MTFLWVLLMPLFSMSQEISNATLYDLPSQQTKKLFTLEIHLSPQGNQMLTRTTYKDLEGVEVVREEGVIQGTELLRYQMERPQTSEKGLFTVKEGIIHFEYEGVDGKKKISEEKVQGSVLAPPNFNAFIQKNWDVLDKGEPVGVRWAVWDRLETVGFTLKKMKDQDHQGAVWMELRMKPTSFIIAALVDPIYLWYNKGSKKLVLMKGRVPPKIKQGSRWKDLDAEVVYTNDQK